jgi:TolB-like protein
VQLKGPDKIIALTANRNRTANFILFSSIEKIENSYILTAKIVDVEKGNVVFATSENAETANSITTACERLADRVSLQVP